MKARKESSNSLFGVEMSDTKEEERGLSRHYVVLFTNTQWKDAFQRLEGLQYKRRKEHVVTCMAHPYAVNKGPFRGGL